MRRLLLIPMLLPRQGILSIGCSIDSLRSEERRVGKEFITAGLGLISTCVSHKVAVRVLIGSFEVYFPLARVVLMSDENFE